VTYILFPFGAKPSKFGTAKVKGVFYIAKKKAKILCDISGRLPSRWRPEGTKRPGAPEKARESRFSPGCRENHNMM
jgi:hypothetical protein